jgi:hypothetical protein
VDFPKALSEPCFEPVETTNAGRRNSVVVICPTKGVESFALSLLSSGVVFWRRSDMTKDIYYLPLAKRVLILLKVAKMQALKEKVSIDKTEGWTQAIDALKDSLKTKTPNIEVELAAIESHAIRTEEANAERLAKGLPPIDDETLNRPGFSRHSVAG